jgi:hypothetical protein
MFVFVIDVKEPSSAPALQSRYNQSSLASLRFRVFHAKPQVMDDLPVFHAATHPHPQTMNREKTKLSMWFGTIATAVATQHDFSWSIFDGTPAACAIPALRKLMSMPCYDEDEGYRDQFQASMVDSALIETCGSS